MHLLPKTKQGKGLAALATGLVMALAPTASASAHPAISDLSCESGSLLVMCTLTYTAHEPATIKWYINGSYRSALDNQTFIRTGCGTQGAPYSVRADVTDVDGTASAYYYGTCQKVWS